MEKSRSSRLRAASRARRRERARVVGWREWVELPALGIPAFRAKIDTGARSSSLHATRTTTFEREGRLWVRFRFGPRSESSLTGRWCEAPSLGLRSIRSSTGELQRRLVIATDLRLGEETWTIEVSLADRAEMGFEMLVGRAAIRRRFLVDPGRSYLAGKPERRPPVPPAVDPAGEEE